MDTMTGAEVQQFDPYAFLAVLGKRVIHPGGRASTNRLLQLAAVRPGQRVLDIGCGVGTTPIRLAREHDARVVAADIAPLMRERAEANVSAAGLNGAARAVSRPAYLRKMAWLMPRMSRAIPYLGYVLVSARKPETEPT